MSKHRVVVRTIGALLLTGTITNGQEAPAPFVPDGHEFGPPMGELQVETSYVVGSPYTVLWWDNTPEYSGQAPNALREAMSDYLDAFSGGAVFDSTYVGSETPGALAAELASNTYDVLVFDSTGGVTFNAADRAAISAHYATKPNLLLDGTLYIRSIDYDLGTIFPGPGGSTGGLTANEVWQIASRGGGIMIGTDHECCQSSANDALNQCIPTAAFSGITYPSVDGQFNGLDLVSAVAVYSPFDLFTHWDSVPTEGIAPTGVFLDVLGDSVELFSQVDVADDPGGGTQFCYVSTSWDPSGVGPEFDCNDNGVLDSIDISNGTSEDVNGNGIPDECDPPELVSSACGETLMATVGVPLSYSVMASDPDPSDVVTLDATGTPATASHTPGLPQVGNPAATTFDWTPMNIDVGTHVIVYTATDADGQQVECQVTIEVAECFLLLGQGPSATSQPYELGGHVFDSNVEGMTAYFPVTMTDGPQFLLSDLLPIAANGLLGTGASLATGAQTSSASTLTIQIVMWNPQVFPGNPAQWSPALELIATPGGRVVATPFGTGNGISVDVSTTVSREGDVMISFPFFIEF